MLTPEPVQLDPLATNRTSATWPWVTLVVDVRSHDVGGFPPPIPTLGISRSSLAMAALGRD